MSERREPKRSCRSAVPYTMTENELIARCRQGDREAQRQLYAKTSEHIYRLLLRMTGNSDDAFDLAQDTYVRAFAKIADFDGKSSVTTWLYRLAVNEALQCARRARKARTHLRARPRQSRRTSGETRRATSTASYCCPGPPGGRPARRRAAPPAAKPSRYSGIARAFPEGCRRDKLC